MSDRRPTVDVIRDIAALFDELADHFEDMQPARTPRAAAIARQATAPTIAETQKMVDGSRGAGKGRSVELAPEIFEGSLAQAIDIAQKIIAGIGANNPQLRAGLQGQLALQHIPYDNKLIDEALRAAKSAPADDEDEEQV